MSRRLLLALGVLTLAAVWLGPLPERAPHAFSAHMAMHMGVVAVAAPLIGLAIAQGRFDPVRRWPRAFPAIQLSVVELLVVWAWHAPALHHAARTSLSGLVAEQGSFLLSGLLVWVSAFGGSAAAVRHRAGAGLVALLLTSMHMTLLGALLALAPRPLYAHPGDPAALDQQHLGGTIMLLVGGAAYLAGGVRLSLRLLRPHSPTPERGLG